MVPVWSEADSHSYRLSEDQARRRQTEPGATDLAVTGHLLYRESPAYLQGFFFLSEKGCNTLLTFFCPRLAGA